LHRNHRKVLVVDDEVAFCGGMNISSVRILPHNQIIICVSWKKLIQGISPPQDYAGVEVGGTGRFRDTHAKIEGPAVLHLAGVFLNSLRRAAHIGGAMGLMMLSEVAADTFCFFARLAKHKGEVCAFSPTIKP
jgi:phosphatidylserine/phosphatidylglycerophosphate/cardiolipin synthase-like enzyme